MNNPDPNLRLLMAATDLPCLLCTLLYLIPVCILFDLMIREVEKTEANWRRCFCIALIWPITLPLWLVITGWSPIGRIP